MLKWLVYLCVLPFIVSCSESDMTVKGNANDMSSRAKRRISVITTKVLTKEN